MNSAEKIQLIIEALFSGKSSVADAEHSVSGLGNTVTRTGDILKTAFGVATVAALAVTAQHLAEIGAQASRQEGAFRALASQAGANSDEIVAAMDKASKGTISHMGLINSAARTMSSGLELDTQKIADIMRVSESHAAAFGITTQEAYERITTAIAYQAPRMLRSVGIVLRAEEVYKLYAASLHKATEELTDEERQAAFMDAVLKKANETTVEMSDSSGLAYTNIERMNAAFANASEKVGKELSPTLGKLAGTLADMVTWWATGATALQQFITAAAIGAAELSTLASKLWETRDAKASLAAALDAGRTALKSFSSELPQVNSGLKETRDQAGEIEKKRIGDILKRGIPEAATSLRRYNEESERTLIAHNRAVAELDKEEKKIGDKDATEAAKKVADREKSVVALEKEAAKQRASAKESLAKSILRLEEENSRSVVALKEGAVAFDRNQAKQSVTIEEERLRRIQELNSSYGLKILEAATDREKAHLEDERLAAVASEEEKARLRKEELADKKKDQQEEFSHQMLMLERTLESQKNTARESTSESISDIDEKLEEQKKASKEALDEDLAAIHIRTAEEKEAIKERREKEKLSFEESKAHAKTAYEERMQQLLDIRTAEEKMSSAAKVLAGTAWAPWLTKAKELGILIDENTEKFKGMVSAAAGIDLSMYGTGRRPIGIGGVGFANGVNDFVVPPGFQGDRFPMFVSSGETVNVTPSGQHPTGGNTYIFQIHTQDPIGVREEIRNYLEQEARR